MGTVKHAPAEGQGARAKLLRPKGTGTVGREGGKFRARLPGSSRTIGGFPTAEEASAALEVRTHAGAFNIAQARRTLLVDWMVHVLELRKAMKLRNTAADHSCIRVRMRPDPIGKLTLAELGQGDLRAWMVRLFARGLAASSVSNSLTIVRRALQHAVELGVLDRNVAKDVEVPRSSRATTKESFEGVLDLGVQKALLAAIAPRRGLSRMVRVALGLGIRRGELLALRWCDVHLDEDEPQIVVRFGKHGMVTKSGKPRRLPLFGLALEAFREARAARYRHPELFPQAVDEALVFVGPHGGKLTKVPRVAFREALRAAGIGRRVRWHDLRHTCGTSLLMGWWGRKWTVAEVQGLLGHSTAAMTEKYLHPRSELIFRAAREMGGRDAKETGPNEAEVRQMGTTRGVGETR